MKTPFYIVIVCSGCGGYLESFSSHSQWALTLTARFDKTWIPVPGHRDVSLVYGGACDCMKVPVLGGHENGEDGS